jgi:uncharacterized RDD family membrane protein YckC
VTTYPATPPNYAMAMRKPTDVMGKRIGAYLLNGLISAIVIIGLFIGIIAATSPGKSYKNVQAATGETAYKFCDNYDPANRNDKLCFATSDDEFILIDSGPFIGTLIGVVVGWWLIDAVILEGLAGGNLGKLIAGLRVVRENGSKPGLGWAFLRNLLLLIPDGIFAGLVGLIVSLTNDDHQRVGDMAASTYVVDKRAAGQPIRSAPAGFGGYGAPGQGAITTPGPSPFGPPSGTQPSPGAAPAPSSPSPASSSPAATATGAAVHQPQWDAARNTYIWWNAQEQQWLEHDRASGTWRPISQ